MTSQNTAVAFIAAHSAAVNAWVAYSNSDKERAAAAWIAAYEASWTAWELQHGEGSDLFVWSQVMEAFEKLESLP